MTDLTKLVKPLVWHRSVISSWNGDYHTVPTGYTIRCADENGWKWSTAGGFGYAHSPEAAQAAANADHAARVVAALDAELLAEVVGALGDLKREMAFMLRHNPDKDNGLYREAVDRGEAVLDKLGAV